MQSAYLCKAQKNYYFSKMAAKIATIVGDVTGLKQRHHQ